MKAGRLSDIARFEKKVIIYVQEARQTTWIPDFIAHAEIRRESETFARFLIRYRRTADGTQINAATHRIKWDGAIWNITSALHDRQRRSLTIECDFSEAIEVTHMQSEVREYIDGLPVLRPPE